MQTNDDELLAYVDEGASAEEMIQAGPKVVDRPISLSEQCNTGIRGLDVTEVHFDYYIVVNALPERDGYDFPPS